MQTGGIPTMFSVEARDSSHHAGHAEHSRGNDGRDEHMTAACVMAKGLHVPEGVVVLPDDSIAFVEQIKGRLSRWVDGTVETVATAPAGAWNSVVYGSDGTFYAAQNGGVVIAWRSENRAVPAIERVHFDGTVETVAVEVDGVPLGAPNDLVFGADGRLYFTDPTHSYNPEGRGEPGKLFALGQDGGELLVHVGSTYCNGLGFLLDGRLLWVESYDRDVCVLEDGERRVLCRLPEEHVPDGLAVAEDGRVFITTVTSHGVTVISPEGEVLDHIYLDDDAIATNCCFQGSALWVTDFGPDFSRVPDGGRLWRVETDAVGAPVLAGSLASLVT